MHDPNTLCFSIYWGRKTDSKGRYKTPLIDVWHLDPEKCGNDDSCGWFIRGHHVDPVLMEKVRMEFEFNFTNNYWFNSKGQPKFSTMGIVMDMYSKAAWKILYDENSVQSGRRKYRKFMRKYLYEILSFAENPTDSLYDSINMTYGNENVSDRVNHFARVIAADVMRKLRPWYKHPRWHVHHWRLSFPILRNFWRYYFQRCSKCGQRGFHGQSGYSDWSGSKAWCDSCDKKTYRPTPTKAP